MNRIYIKTDKREYFIAESGGLWSAGYRPLNPRTGQPWQACRFIGEHDAYTLSNWRTGALSPVTVGPAPAFEDWSGKGWAQLNRGFSTRALAEAAVAVACHKNKETPVLVH